jgi:hypothetical protein
MVRLKNTFKLHEMLHSEGFDGAGKWDSHLNGLHYFTTVIGVGWRQKINYTLVNAA